MNGEFKRLSLWTLVVGGATIGLWSPAPSCSHPDRAGKTSPTRVTQEEPSAKSMSYDIQLIRAMDEKTFRRFITFVDSATITRAVRRYIDVENSLPSSYEQLVNAGYLFFKPYLVPDAFEITGDTLTVTCTCSAFNPHDPNEVETVKTEFLRPESTSDIERRRKIATSSWESLQSTLNRYSRRMGTAPPPDSPLRKITLEDFLTGRVSNLIEDKLRRYANDDSVQLSQLMWAWELRRTLAYYLSWYYTRYETYPSTISQLFDFIGERIPKAWVAPATGKVVPISNELQTGAICYAVSEDGLGLEVHIPLFGAGATADVESFMKLTGKSYGFYPGEHLRLHVDPQNPREIVFPLF